MKKNLDILSICDIIPLADAGIAHPVERHLAKVEVASSSLVARSIQNLLRLQWVFFIRGYGGIGRHAGFRFQWATVQVQVLLPAPEKAPKRVPFLVRVTEQLGSARAQRGGSDGSRLCGFLVPLGSSSSDVREILQWIPLSDCFLPLSHIFKLCYTVINTCRKGADNQ